MITLSDGRTELWQWDTGVNVTVVAGVTQVHFANKIYGRAYVSTVTNGEAQIPDELLQSKNDIDVWAFVGTSHGGYTKISKRFKVNARNKPNDYFYTPTEQISFTEALATANVAMQIAQSVREDADNGVFGGEISDEAIARAVESYLQEYPIVETDPTVPRWAKQPTKPKYTASEVGALPDTTVIPPAYILPIAKADTLGGVKPVAKTNDMTQAVGVDADGRLWSIPSVGGGELADGTVTTAKLADGAVTSSKLGLWVEPIECYLSNDPFYYSVPDVLGRTLYFVINDTNEYLKLSQIGYYDHYGYEDVNSCPFMRVTTATVGDKLQVYGRFYLLYAASFELTNDELYHTWLNTNGAGKTSKSLRLRGTGNASIAWLSECMSVELWSEDFVDNGYAVAGGVDKTFSEIVNMAVGGGTGGVGNLESLNGKKWIAIGDSYTHALANSGGAFATLADELGMTILNHGVVSSTIRDAGVERLGYAYRPIVCRVCNIPSEDTTGNTIVGDYVPLTETDVGLVTFMGGTNDSWGVESSLGSGIEDMDISHIYGACHRIFQTLMTSYPSAVIMVILQPSSANCTDSTDPEGNDLSRMNVWQKSIVKSHKKQTVVREVAEFYGLPIVDCAFDWYSPANPAHLSRYWQGDMLHLTDEGYTALADKLVRELSNITSGANKT